MLYLKQIFAVCLACAPLAAETWRGLEVQDERSCSTYSRSSFYYQSSQGLERMLADRLNWCLPYSNQRLTGLTDLGTTDIEHIIALREAHDSGMCSASVEVKREFGNDPLNLTLARASVNRSKGSKDAGEWLPDQNRCWFAFQVVRIKAKYRLSIDRRERDALESILDGCAWDFELKQESCCVDQAQMSGN